jgi:hypothetical protein
MRSSNCDTRGKGSDSVGDSVSVSVGVSKQEDAMPGMTKRKRSASRKRVAVPAKKAPSQRKRKAAATVELRQSDLVAFLATSDSGRARQFYETVVGLRLIADDPFAVVFDANGVMLRIQKVDAVRPSGYTALGWRVADIAGTIRDLVSRGAQFQLYPGLEQDDLGVWRSPSGTRIAWFKDVDGNTLSVSQS